MINFYPFLMKSCAWRLFQILEEEKMINIVMMTIVQIISKHVSTLSFIFDPLSSVYTNQMPMVWPTNLLQNILETLILILDFIKCIDLLYFTKQSFLNYRCALKNGRSDLCIFSAKFPFMNEWNLFYFVHTKHLYSWRSSHLFRRQTTLNFRQIRIVNAWLYTTYKCKHMWVWRATLS
jgi:hypothetical protein